MSSVNESSGLLTFHYHNRMVCLKINPVVDYYYFVENYTWPNDLSLKFGIRDKYTTWYCIKFSLFL